MWDEALSAENKTISIIKKISILFMNYNKTHIHEIINFETFEKWIIYKK